MNIDRFYQKILASQATGVRGDFSIADFQKVDQLSAHVLLDYQPTLGKPTSEDIERYFAKNFEGRLLPVMASCSIKPNAISIIAQVNVPTRDIKDIEDKGKMIPIVANMMYLDTQLQDHWEVKTDETGKKVLSKTSKDNVEQIIAVRRNRMFVTKSPSISLSSLAQAKDLLPMGSTVKAWHKGEVKAIELSERIEGGFKGKDEAGKEVVVAKEAVLDLMKMALDKIPNESAKLAKYFADAYGSKSYAQELTKIK